MQFIFLFSQDILSCPCQMIKLRPLLPSIVIFHRKNFHCVHEIKVGNYLKVSGLFHQQTCKTFPVHLYWGIFDQEALTFLSWSLKFLVRNFEIVENCWKTWSFAAEYRKRPSFFDSFLYVLNDWLMKKIREISITEGYEEFFCEILSPIIKYVFQSCKKLLNLSFFISRTLIGKADLFWLLFESKIPELSPESVIVELDRSDNSH